MCGQVKSVYDLLSSKPGGLELLKDPKLGTATAEVAASSENLMLSSCTTYCVQDDVLVKECTN